MNQKLELSENDLKAAIIKNASISNYKNVSNQMKYRKKLAKK